MAHCALFPVIDAPFCTCAVHFQQQKSNHLVRKELQAHQSAHQQMLAGYTDYIKRHTHVLLQLVLNNPQVSPAPLSICLAQCCTINAFSGKTAPSS